MEGGVGAVGEQPLLAKTAEHATGRVELRERRKGRICASKAIGVRHAGEPDANGGHVGGGQFDVAQIAIEACRIRADVPISKIPHISKDSKGTNLMAGSA